MDGEEVHHGAEQPAALLVRVVGVEHDMGERGAAFQVEGAAAALSDVVAEGAVADRQVAGFHPEAAALAVDAAAVGVAALDDKAVEQASRLAVRMW